MLLEVLRSDELCLQIRHVSESHIIFLKSREIRKRQTEKIAKIWRKAQKGPWGAIDAYSCKQLKLWRIAPEALESEPVIRPRAPSRRSVLYF